MSGHVFHPGHEALHGITVVVRENGGRLWVGRYHERNDRGVVMHDVAVFEPGQGDVEEWLARQRKFGVQVARKHVIVPAADVASLERFAG